MRNCRAHTGIRSFSAVLLIMAGLGCNVPNSSSSAALTTGPAHEADSTELRCLSTSASIVGLSDTALHFTGNASLHGSVVLMGQSTLDLSGNASVSDTVYTRSSDNVTLQGHPTVGSVVIKDYSSVEPALTDFINQLDALTSTQQSIAQVTGSTEIEGSGALNVIDIQAGIELSGNSHLVLHGSQNDEFVVRVLDGGISVSGNAAIQLDGVSSRKVLFLVKSGEVTVSGNASAIGTYVAPNGPASFSGNGRVEGACVASGSIDISGNGLSFTPAAWCPQIDLPAPSPVPSSSVTPNPCPSATPTPSVTPTPTPTITPDPTPTTTPDPTSTGTPAPTATDPIIS